MTRRRALLIAGAALAAAPPLRAAPAAPGEPVRWPALTLLDGTPWQATAGRPQVVVFWSLSCPFCQRHNVHVEKLHRASLARPGPGVLTAVRERDAAAVRRHLAQHGWSFPVTLDGAPLAAALGSRRVVPLTVVVDSHGRLRQSIPGEMFEEDVMELMERAA